MRQKMCGLSCFSLFVFVVSAAIPMSKRKEGELTIEGKDLTVHGNDLLYMGKTRLDTPSKKEVTSHINNKTYDANEIHKESILSLIKRGTNYTTKFHSHTKKIFESYRHANKSEKNEIISSFRDYVRKNLSSQLNKPISSSKIRSSKFKPYNNATEKTASEKLDKDRNNTGIQHKKNQLIQQTDKSKETDMKDKLKLQKLKSSKISPLSDDANRAATGVEGVATEPTTSCQHVTGLYEPRWLLMVTQCPADWKNSSTRTQCELWESLNTLTFMDAVTFLPVQDQNGIVYANIYCAKCHGVIGFLPWTTSFLCDKASSQTFHLWGFTDLSLLYSYLPSSTCERQVIPSIPESLKECKKDIFQMVLNARKSVTTTTDYIPTSYPVSFNVLMNFDFTGHTHLLFSVSQQVVEEEYISRCQEGKTFDPVVQSCRNLTCSKFYTLEGNKCVRTSNEPTFSDGITDLSQLRTVSLVTLEVNITFADYINIKFKDIEPDVVLQVASLLNISAVRLKDVNITYELGHINGTALQVSTLTEVEYASLFPHFSLNMTSNKQQNRTKSSLTQGAPFESFMDVPEFNYSKFYNNTNGNTNQSTDTNATTTGSGDEKALKYYINRKKMLKTNSRLPHTANISTSNEVTQNNGSSLNKEMTPELSVGENKTSEGHSENDALEHLKDFNFNFDMGNIFVNKKLLQEALKYHGTLARINDDSFFRYRFTSQDNHTNLFISVPFNDQKERVCLLLKDSETSLQFLLAQSMVMHVSFVLVPPDDPMSREPGLETVMQKIDKLIIEQQFSLNLNGNDVEVVAADDDRDGTADPEFCPLGVDYIVYDDEFMMISNDNETIMYVNKTNSYVGVGLFDLYVLVSGSNSAEETNFTDMMEYAFVCFMPRIIESDCDRIDVSKSEYYVAGDNKSVMFENKEYDIFEYRVVDTTTGRIQICVPSTFKDQDQKILPRVVTINTSCSSDFDGALRAEGYMTLVLGRISTFALSCVIITYLLFPILRNLPGLNTMNLTSCLLITQVLFAEGIGSNQNWFCTAVAISLHYTLLAAHFWMNVTSYDVYKTFTNTVITNRVREKSKFFKRYALYAWGVPLVIVSICVFVDFSRLFEGVSIGYWDPASSTTNDKDSNPNCSTTVQDTIIPTNNTSLTGKHTIHSCWITQPLAALVAFGAIILIFFFVNCIFFGKTIRSISRTSKIAKKSLTTRHSNSSFSKVSDNSEVMLFFKMSTVMGFTWVFGLGSSILSSFVKTPTETACAITHLLAILFIIFNTTQGIFIFVAFVCNRRVLGLYKGLIQKVKTFICKKRRNSIFYISSSISSKGQQ